MILLANNEGPDQTAGMQWLSWVLAVGICQKTVSHGTAYKLSFFFFSGAHFTIFVLDLTAMELRDFRKDIPLTDADYALTLKKSIISCDVSKQMAFRAQLIKTNDVVN